MSPRDDDLAKLAGLRGWWFFAAVHDVKPAKFILTQAEERREFPIPSPDAPLPDALAFVGRLCEAVGIARPSIVPMRDHDSGEFWRVYFANEGGHASDLAWAAVRAALAAKGVD